jgi:hypothetical protein
MLQVFFLIGDVGLLDTWRPSACYCCFALSIPLSEQKLLVLS